MQQELYNTHKVNAIIHKNSKLNVILKKSTTKSDLAKYYHACCFSPLKSTLTTAIKQGHFLGWPGLTEALIQRFLPNSIATAKGHLNQEKKNLQSTKKSYKDALLETLLEEQFHPKQDENAP